MTRQPKSPRPRMVQVLIVDDHPAVREGLSIRLSAQPDLHVCGEAEDEAQALELITTTRPDLLVIDISLKTGSGIDVIKRVRLRNKSVRILVWSMYPDSLYAERALRAGAQGYINKEQATDRIIEAIRRILAGKIYLSDDMTEKILQKSSGTDEGDHDQTSELPVEALSDRELEAFQLIGQGLDTHEIAAKMHISTKTVDTYRVRIKSKLRISNVHQLIHTASTWVSK